MLSLKNWTPIFGNPNHIKAIKLLGQLQNELAKKRRDRRVTNNINYLEVEIKKLI